ncbi:sugar phosphate isomerase/epimerase family protein [Ochrobactrum sp. A-1]|uniref:sugar phosphate isomerase/epimerase family protein n=1 Tax=Ochrobactrum sp. A-1 TaxID=2920940 RepID=UPI001F0B2CDC|nr:sugar phosphate isomerase/epimerase [Ochrobactrum sp. A-1]
MRLAISNIAWDISEDLAVAKLLDKFGIDAIDIAPGKYFPHPANAEDDDIVNVRRWWADHGIEITGMQALLFGTVGLNVFGEDNSQQAMLDHLRAMCRIGAGLGATRLVFGSPKNRDRTGLSDAQAFESAVSFFRRLGDAAQEHGVVVCLEPNPARYGANFMMTSEETAHIVTAVGHGAIQMQFDTGALKINGESSEAVLESSSSLIGHVHASEPDLVPLGDGGADHQLIHKSLQKHLPDHIVTIEMIATKEEPHLHSIERALICAIQCYRTAQGVA